MPKVTRSVLLGWYLYDWANSAFVTSVVTVFLGPYLTSLSRAISDSNGFITNFGFAIYSDSLFTYLVSFSVILQAIILPILSSIADYTNQKKSFLFFFAFLGSFFAMCLFFLKAQTIVLGSVAFVLANLFFGLSVVMYNSLLNHIAEVEDRDQISSIGWAYGYLGGGIVLTISLVLFTFRSTFNILEEQAIRFSMLLAGFWWAFFSFVSYQKLRPLSLITIPLRTKSIFSKSLLQLRFTISNISKNKNATIFLIAYLFYNDGIQSIIVVSSIFGKHELGLSLDFLIIVILLVQFIAFLGALLFERIAKSFSAKNTIFFSLVVWIAIVLYAFTFLTTREEFLLLSILIGLVLGGSQALSRSFFSVLIPKNCEAEYFSLYEISEKGTSWIGPAVFGLVLQFSGSYKFAILSLILFFLIGFFLLYFVEYRPGEINGN
ncbi:MAG: MFS transporter [Candidatus Kapaibacteriales bacterium]